MKILFTLFSFAASLGLMAQSDYDERLLSRYSEERIEELLEKQPSTIEYWTFYLDNSYIIIDSEASGKVLPTDEEVKIADVDSFNILDLDIHMDRKTSKAYRIKGTNLYLILKSNDQFSKEFSRNRSSNSQ
jgi:hypothetical protein